MFVILSYGGLFHVVDSVLHDDRAEEEFN